MWFPRLSNTDRAIPARDERSARASLEGARTWSRSKDRARRRSGPLRERPPSKTQTSRVMGFLLGLALAAISCGVGLWSGTNQATLVRVPTIHSTARSSVEVGRPTQSRPVAVASDREQRGTRTAGIKTVVHVDPPSRAPFSLAGRETSPAREVESGPPPDPGNDESTAPPTLPTAMNWQQYRGWTKYADALQRRDYKAVDAMLPEIQRVFGDDVSGALVDALVDDYAAYLNDVVQVGCDGYEPESVWRKTMYMPFVLVRLRRNSATLDEKSAEARSRCGFAS